MTNRYDNNDERARRMANDQGRQSARSNAGGTARQRFTDDQEVSAHGRLSYDAQNRDHGQAARTSGNLKRSAADYSRERYATQRTGSSQRLSQRSEGAQGQQQRSVYTQHDTYDQQSMANSQRRAAYEQNRRQRQAGAGRRQVPLDQSGQIPRYVPQKDPRSKQQIAMQRNQMSNSSPMKPVASIADRFSRNNRNAYHARTNPAGQTASTAQGFLSTPFSYLVRIALIVVLVAIFAIRMMMGSGPAQQLQDVQTTIASQQEVLDTLTDENAKLQENIDSRQATLDAYNALL